VNRKASKGRSLPGMIFRPASLGGSLVADRKLQPL
jgi:hypothetical protein